MSSIHKKYGLLMKMVVYSEYGAIIGKGYFTYKSGPMEYPFIVDLKGEPFPDIDITLRVLPTGEEWPVLIVETIQ